MYIIKLCCIHYQIKGSNTNCGMLYNLSVMALLLIGDGGTIEHFNEFKGVFCINTSAITLVLLL